jgi:hypothetical protein
VPVFGPVSSVTSGSYQIPTNGSASTNAYYVINLAVTDTNGNTASASTEVFPQTAMVTPAAVPAGLIVTLDGQTVTNGNSIAEIVGMNHLVSAPSPQSLDSTSYKFVLWSDGGAETHDIIVPPTNTTLTASFVQPAITVAPALSGFYLSWPQWAAGLQLYTATNLQAPVWIPVTNAPAASNNQVNVTLPTTNFMQFYRLRLP